jgi:alkaline phosphatase
MVSDGMSAGVLPMAERFSRLVRGRGTNWAALQRRKDAAQGFFDMASLSSPVTDSAAASSSWGSGSRIFNAQINVLPDGRKLTPVAKVAKEAGLRTGLVTTATVTHATPAGFGASQERRDDEALIAPQYLSVVDVVLGGGRRFFSKEVTSEFAGKGYRCVTERGQLQGSKAGDKWLGLFSASHIPFTIDRDQSEALQREVPTLSEMTEAALAALSGGKRGFLLQVEGAKIDHAAHANDPATLLWEQLAFDDAIGVCLEYQKRNPQTLIVITTDHGNSNPGLNGTGPEYRESGAAFARLKNFKASFGVIAAKLGSRSEYSGVARTEGSGTSVALESARQTIGELTGIRLEDHEVKLVVDALARSGRVLTSNQLNNLDGALGMALGNHTGVGWTGTSHTSDYAVLTATGPGAGQFHGLLRNTEAFGLMTGFMGVKFQNPTLTEEEAMKFAASAPRDLDPHWV